MPTTLKCCEAGSRVSPPYPVSPFSATFCRRTEASGGSGPYMGIFRIIIRSKIGVSKNYENYSFYSPRFLSPYMGLFLSQRWSVFIIVRSLFARVIKTAHCSFFRNFAHGIIRFGRLSAGYLPASQCGNVGTRTGLWRLVVWGYPTECRQISEKWRLASKWAIMSRTVPKGVDAPWLCSRIADKAYRLRAMANRVQWWPQRGRELQSIAARKKRTPYPIKLRGA